VKGEIKILSNIKHPFIVGLSGYFQDDKCIYLVLDYVPGGELYSRLRDVDRLSADHAKFYAMEIVLAFEYLHNMDIIYRDLKPENLLITLDGHLKLTDFGFAKVVDDGLTWTLCGTPEYLAPEIIHCQGHGKSVDWWTLGILTYEMLTGYPPFLDDNPMCIYQKILTCDMNYPRNMQSKAKSFIKKLLTNDRTKRLGCIQGGAATIKAHKWFKQCDWAAAAACQLETPFKPEVVDPGDVSHFDVDEYSDSDHEPDPRRLNTAEEEIFRKFDLS